MIGKYDEEIIEEFKLLKTRIDTLETQNKDLNEMIVSNNEHHEYMKTEISNAIKDHVWWIQLFKEKNLLHKVLLSHDGNSFNGKDQLRGYKAVIPHLVPALKENGFSDDEINQLLVLNPKNAFRVEVRNL